MDWLLVPITQLIDFITNGIYDFTIETFQFLMLKLTLFTIEAVSFFITFAWDITKLIFDQVGITDSLQQAWSYLDSGMLSTLSFFGIPDVINIITTAFLTSFLLKFVPFLGK